MVFFIFNLHFIQYAGWMPSIQEKIVYDHVVYPIIWPISVPTIDVEG